MTRKSHKRRIGSGFQQVSQRLLMAGDVDVSFTNNDLYITGDNANNRVDISTVDGVLKVTGTYWTGNTTINNGSQPFEIDANLVDDIWIDVNGGNDRVFVNQVHLNNTSHGTLEVKTDGGDDLVGVYNSSARDIKVRTGSGDDHAIVSYSAASRDIYVDLDSGHDEADLYAAFAGDDIRVYGGTGNDDVAAQGADAADDFYADLGDGDDILWLYGGEFGDVIVDADKGDDRVTLQGVEITDDLDIEMDEGYDQLYIYNTNVADNVYLHGGSDADKLGASGNDFDAFAKAYSF